MKKSRTLLLAVPMLVLAAGAAGQVDSKKIPRDTLKMGDGPVSEHHMVLTEKAFARASMEQGISKAFMTYLAEDSIIFRPGPVGGPQWFKERGEVKATLDWQPTYAEVAGSGDIGFTTGPYQYEEPAAEEGKPSVVQHGHYVSVWEKQLPGWRVVIDHGIQHVKQEKGEKVEFRAHSEGTAIAMEKAIPALSTLDQRFAGVTSLEVLQELYGKHGAEDLRVYRNHHLPIVGKKQAVEALAELTVFVAGSMEGAGLSKAGDMAYTYGTGTLGKLGEEATAPGSFLRVWRNEGGENWKLVVDLASPLPKPPEPAPTSAGG